MDFKVEVIFLGGGACTTWSPEVLAEGTAGLGGNLGESNELRGIWTFAT